ncbi:MAG: hypothetical protein M3N18_10115 [Actinomycetota bacterium]|nr:hypothetical protein [Actinomycetota bacterium]
MFISHHPTAGSHQLLADRCKECPTELRERLRAVETWGPFPIQPAVLRSNLDPELKDRLCAALLALGAGFRVPSALAEFGLVRFAPAQL